MKRNLVKFSKGSGRLLRLEKNITIYQYRLWADLLKTSSVEKDLGVLVHNRLTVSQ